MYDNLSQVTYGFEKKAKTIGGDKSWILIARSGCSCGCESIMNGLDKIVSNMPDTEEFLDRINRIIPAKAKTFAESYNDEFLDAMVEIVGWGWLYDNYPQKRIQLKKTGKQKTADLIVLDDDYTDNLLAAMECKRLRNSDINNKFFKNHNVLSKVVSVQQDMVARDVDTRLLSTDPSENPLLYKLICTLCKAEEQLNESEAPHKFILIDFSFDVSAALGKPERLSLIKRLAKMLEQKNIRLIPSRDFQVIAL